MSLLKVNAIQNIAGVERFGPVLMTPVTASGTSVDFTGIPSWAKRVTVLFNGISTSGTSIIQLQLGSSGGIENTGYLCASSNITSAVLSANYTTGFGLRIADTATQLVHGAIRFNNISGNIWIADGIFARSDGSVTGPVGGTKTLTGILDRIRVTTVNGTDTFDAGIINVMYE